jgi:hypothetical protein
MTDRFTAFVTEGAAGWVDVSAKDAVRAAARKVQGDLLREIFGNPFRAALAIDASLLRWNDGLIPRLAAAAYEGRAFDRLPILADALEEAGCSDADLLGHLRGPGPHVLGCCAVDALLGKG